MLHQVDLDGLFSLSESIQSSIQQMLQIHRHDADFQLTQFRNRVKPSYFLVLTDDKNETAIAIVRYYPASNYLQRSYARPKSHCTYLDNFCVALDQRRKGYGSQLLQHIIQLPESRDGVFLNVELDQSTEPARQMYSKFGFRVLHHVDQTKWCSQGQDLLFYKKD